MPQSYQPYDPEFPSPYPEDWRRVHDFKFESPLWLTRAEKALAAGGSREAEYIVAAPYSVSMKIDDRPDRHRITVPSGMLTDLTSVPRVGRFFVSRVGPHLEAAIVHDFLFIAWQDLDGGEPRERDFDFANATMVAAMEAARVPAWKRAIIHLAVASFVGRWTYDERDGPPRYVRVPAPPTSPLPVPRPSGAADAVA